MPGTTKRARSVSTDRVDGGRGAVWAPRRLSRLRSPVLAVVLPAVVLLAAVLSGSAWAAGNGEPSPFASTQNSFRFGALAETPKAPAVTKQPPKEVTVNEGQSAVFESTASGVPAPTVQWERSTNGGTVWSQLEGATSDQLTIASTKTSESGYRYRAVFKNSAGEATSKEATLTVHAPAVVTQQPKSTTVNEGESAVFEASASGVPTPTVNWEVSSDGGTTWGLVSGGTSYKLTIAGTKTSFSGRLYRAKFKNVAGTATTETATLTVQKAPAVTKQPASTTVNEGESAVFEATASGFPTPTVQWEVSTNGASTWSPVEGATSNQLTVANTKTSESGYEYRAVFKNPAGVATSAAATLTVHAPPLVTQQPESRTVEEGESAAFEAAASGVPVPTIQWERSATGGHTWVAITGATANRLTVANTKASENGYEYRATFTNVAGKATSEVATLTVHKAPKVTKQPASTTVDEGQSAVFEATASGFPAPTVQWEISTNAGGTWAPIEGATSTQLTVANTKLSESGYEYRATFTNAAGKATSEAATLTVHQPPVVTQQPSSTIVKAGESAVFEAAATGTPAPTVQWERSTNGGSTWSAIEGATSDQLTVTTPSTSESGTDYRATFTNAAGSVTTAVATLTVATNQYNAVGWGQNIYRQLGSGSSNSLFDAPVPVIGLKFVVSVAAGGHHSLALIANGTVVAWGLNSNGQIGDGTTVVKEVPLEVKGLSGVRAIAAGGTHSLALLTNGTVMAWGNNESGQLGIGTNTDSEVPVAVKGLTNVKAISAGANHSLALLASGAVMAWGDDEAGQLGNGATKSSNVPVVVKGLTGVTAISAGGAFSLALLNKETVEAWGSNLSKQLGNSAVEEGFSDVPVPVSTLTGVTAIAAGDKHGLALLSAGTIMAWGDDSHGELGNGTIKASEATPVAVSGLSGVKAISAGGEDSVALLGEGSLAAWGINEWGTLGNGATGSPSDVPVTVSGLGKAASISAGGFHMLAYGEPIPTVTSVSPKLGPTAGGATVSITGVNLTGATAVKFGATAAASFTVNSSTSITATSPAATGPGTVNITVTTPSGTSPAGLPDRYTYQGPPTVVKLSVRFGPVAGGTSTVITGTEFAGVSAVHFGAASATSFTVTSPTTITAVSPAGSPGTIDVTVTNTAGPSATVTSDHFRYTPTVESVTPNAGPVAGGTSVTVGGSGFAVGIKTTTFKFGASSATAVNCTSTTTCTMLSPIHAAGAVDVTAVVNKSSSPINAPADRFTYS